jgi:ATP-dependent Clp protease protease subunit
MSFKLFNFTVLCCFSFLAVQLALAQEKPEEEELQQFSSDASAESQYKILNQEVKWLKLEKAKLVLEHETQLLQLQQEKKRLSLENELYAAKQTQLLAELYGLKKRLVLENTIQKQRQKQQIAALQQEQDLLKTQNTILEEQNKQRKLEFEARLSELDFQKTRLDKQVAKRKKRQEWESQVNTVPKYLKEPLVNGRLIISERRIALDGPIIQGTADYIIERINFFNNKNAEYPIFLVIGYCRGGSVMEGSKILKTMQKSSAPVYVVVKSFAASMAAVITTLAKRSYAYPDAMIVHHQVWHSAQGNRTEQVEKLKLLDEWTQRVIKPVADKMEITLAELVEKMYAHNSTGNWYEFANVAVKHKWIDYVVEDIRDTSFVKKPPKKKLNPGAQLLDLNGENVPFQNEHTLPSLNPFDVYHLYNQDNYYRYSEAP